MTITATETVTHDWTEIGVKVLPAAYRARFLAVLAGGKEPASQFEARAVRWSEPNGSHPMSPGMSLQAVINEFDIRPVVAVAYNLAWEAHDTDGRPGYFGDYTVTNTVLAVRTRKQTLWFLDGGCSITPVMVESYPEGHPLRTTPA